MNLSEFSVNRPIFVTMLVFIVIILGMVSLSRIPIDLMPDITYPTLSVSTRYENASPEEIESLVTQPIEGAMSAVPSVKEVSSVSREGSSNVRVMFAWGTNLDAAANDIRDRLDRVIRRLPEDAERPTLRKFDLAAFPVLILGASSKLDPVEMRNIIDDEVKYRIERVPGVAAMDVWGGLEREVHVNLNLDKVKGLGLPLDLVLKQISAGNVTLPAGTIERGNLEVAVRTPGEYTSLEEVRDTVIIIRDGVPVRVRDIAEVEDLWKKPTRMIRVDGVPGMYLAVNKQSGTNTVEVSEKVLAEIERINEDIPQLRMVPIIDTSNYIRRSITNVGSTALFGGIFAVLVLLFFLRNIRSTAVIATAIPISIIATFALMYFAGFTLNIMTLGGLALGIGMLVDSSIVVLENITRLRESGRDARQAAVEGTREVTAAIVASTLTTLAVFLPLIFVRGMAGVMFKQLAIVVSFSLACSLGVALTLVPMLAARFLRAVSLEASRDETLGHKVFRLGGLFFKRIEDRYKSLLHFALSHRLLVVFMAAIVLGGSLALVPLVGVELMPSSDEGEVRVSGEMEVGTKLSVLDEKFKVIESVVRREVPEVKRTVSRIGGSHWHGAAHTGSLRIALKSMAERERSSEEIANVLRSKLSGIPGVTIRTRAGQGLFLMRMLTRGADKVQVEIRGYDLETADVLASRIKRIVESVDGITDARLSRESGSPEELVMVDRQKAADMKLTMSQIADMLQTVLSGKRATYFREGGEEYGILVKLKDAEHLALRDILELTLTNAEGIPVSLRNVAHVRSRSGPVQIEHKDQERVVTVSAEISGRDMGSVLADIREGVRSIPMPRGFSVGFGGEYEEQQKAFRELALSLFLAVVLVYMVMASLYESLRDPFVVMFSVPMAAVGVILMLFLTNTTFNIQSFIGCIMLAGIVVNNAILLVDHTNLLRRRDKMPIGKAIEEAGRRRIRPILMTAATTSFALLPLAIGLGEGGEAQAPLARAVIGGLLSSSLITLILVPTVYSVFERRKKKQDPENKKASHSVSFSLFYFTIALLISCVVCDSVDCETDPLELTVEEAILLSLENNRSFKVQRFNPAILATFEEEERSAFDPSLNAELSSERAEAQRLSSSGLEDYGSDETSAAVSVETTFPAGTTVSVEASTDLTGSSLYADELASSWLGLTVTQSLLKGRGSGVNLASLRQAKLDTAISQYELRGFAESLIGEVEKTYWDFSLAERQIEIFDESVKLAEQQLKETSERIEIGKLPETELAAAQAEIALRREDLINARSTLSKTRLKLLRFLNPPGVGLWERQIVLRSEPAVPDVRLDKVEKHVEIALRMRPDLNEARSRLERGELEVVKTKNGLLPKLDLFISLGKTGYADSFSRSWGELGADTYELTGGLQLEYPIGNRGAGASHERAVLSRDQAQEAVNNLIQIVEVDVRSAYVEVNRAKEQVSATGSTRKFQEEKLRVEREKFRVGRSTSLLVAQAQRDLVASQISEVKAVVNYLAALIDLYRLEGSLLERRGIESRIAGT